VGEFGSDVRRKFWASMKLKPAILSILGRDDLKRVVDDLGLEGVDRRSVESMRTAIAGSRRAAADDLLSYLRKGGLSAVCDTLGLPTVGTKEDLLARLRNGMGTAEPATKKRATPNMDQVPTPANGQPVAVKKPIKLTLAKLESLLFKACDILRGKMDASEYKEYIFGMLFLKRLSDQFDQDMAALRAWYAGKMRADLIEQQLANPQKYNFFVPADARWDQIRHLKTSVGSGLNKALAAIEDANPNTLQDVLKGINFNRKIGQKVMEDEKLVEFIQHFDEIPLGSDCFEFPDLLGAAYEYLIKYFADSAGKKGGEFYTPAEVVRLLVQIVEPVERMTIYDPTVGSGGMLIQSKDYVEEIGGNSRNLALAGQEDNGGTWAICKMNMILHGVNSSDIRQGDTLKDPQHLATNGELRRFDRVIANPPFSQNYSKKEMKFSDRFHVFMPETGKKADLIFVQHMVSVLKSDGKMACVMPHGVLFRGGAEEECRKRFITEGWLEAIIGLPPGLFYGTGIPASVLVINKDGASQRKTVLFINADREYKEGKNQNSLRPEDIEKITHVYRHRLSVEKYSREVPHEELERNDFNLNIRRYVDNSPPPEPHDVRAHLHGGIPLVEVDALNSYFANYAGVRELLFQPRDAKYLNFATAVTDKDQIKKFIESAPGTQAKHAAFHKALGEWWESNLPAVAALPTTQNVFALRRQFMASIAEALVPQNVLDGHKVRGAFASYMSTLAGDYKSVAASGWNAELIPEEEILQSQFPDVLAGIEKDQARIIELEAMFAAVDVDDEEDGEAEPTDSGVLPKELVKSLKEQKKDHNGTIKELSRIVKEMGKDIKRMERAAASATAISAKKDDVAVKEVEVAKHQTAVAGIDKQLQTHASLEAELKTLRANMRQAEAKKDELVAAARAKITETEAKELILARLRRVLGERLDEYLRQYQRGLVVAVETLWDKYAVTTKQILADRDREATQLDKFLKELGYES
jgi:type I restriction enzyme M protein